MCLKNINTDITFFSDVSSDDDNGDIINLLCVHKNIPDAEAKFLNAKKDILVIENLDFLFSANATERIDENRNTVHTSDENPDNTFFFDESYEIKFRITETSSGMFLDLDGAPVLCPSQEKTKLVSLCRKIYSKKITYKFQNIKVATPPEGKHLCVLKVLIRRKRDDVENNNWVVQSMHPIKLIESN